MRRLVDGARNTHLDRRQHRRADHFESPPWAGDQKDHGQCDHDEGAYPTWESPAGGIAHHLRYSGRPECWSTSTLRRTSSSFNTLPVPRTTQPRGSSARCTCILVLRDSRSARPGNREPPPANVMPRAIISATSSGGV